MRIAYVVPRYLPHIGGVETHVDGLARHMARSGHTVEVLTPEVGQSRSTVEAVDGITVRRFPTTIPTWRYAYSPHLMHHLRRHASSYDLIHAHSYHALPALQATRVSRPIVFTPHYHGTGHTPLARALHVPYRVMGRRIFRRSAHIICVSAPEARLVIRDFPEVAGRVSVIPNGVHAAPILAARPYSSDRTTILSVGRLERYKRVDRALRALTHLDLQFQLVIIGEGPARTELKDLASRLGVSQRARFLGRIDDSALRRWYRSTAVCVSLSEHEAYGLTLIESAIAGASVVASNIPAHADVVAMLGPRAQLVPLTASSRDLATAIERANLSERGALPAGVVLDWTQVAARTCEIYDAILLNPSAAQPCEAP